MKYRIIKREDGKYQVQEKFGLFGTWTKCYLLPSEYGKFFNDEDYRDDATSHLCVAQEKMHKLIQDERDKQLKKRFTVVEEAST